MTKIDKIITGIEWIKENQSHGVSGACDDLIEKCEELITSSKVDAETIVEKFIQRHNNCCAPGYEVPQCDREVIKNLIIEFYDFIKGELI